MFSGIVQKIGTIEEIYNNGKVRTFSIKFSNSQKCNIGDSVAINGTCLTVIELNNYDNTAKFNAVPETLTKTNLDKLKINDSVNTELSLCYGDSIGGHIVQGHVDEKGSIKKIEDVSGAWLIEISVSKEFLNYLVKKGFVTIDGMSITVINVLKNSFTITLIPNTIEATIAKNYIEGSIVNLEADPTSKYIYKYIQGFKNNV